MRAAWLVMCLVACGPSNGDDGGGDGGTGSDGSGNGKLIATGGVSNAPLGGKLHVFAVETNSSTPIANAAVQVGSLSGTTDASGLASFDDASLTGKVNITVSATGHAAATWVGVTGANVTIPLEATPRNIPTAKATGTITGFSGLPSPSFGHYNLGIVLYSFLDDPSAPENSLVQPLVSGAPADACVDSSGGGNCSWSLVTRIGTQVHFAVILDGDAHLTANDTSDDTYTLIGYARRQRGDDDGESTADRRGADDGAGRAELRRDVPGGAGAASAPRSLFPSSSSTTARVASCSRCPRSIPVTPRRR